MTDTKLVKSAGEHWVCSVLARLGWGVALTRDGLEHTDILAVQSASRRMIEVQVKTASHMPKPNWPVNLKAQELARTDRQWFVFVALGDRPWGAPRSFVVPRDHAAATAFIAHRDWRTDPAAKPGTRNASLDQCRVGDALFEGYEDRWDLLSAPADDAPVLLPSHLRDLALDPPVGLPEGHPWRTKLPNW